MFELQGSQSGHRGAYYGLTGHKYFNKNSTIVCFNGRTNLTWTGPSPWTAASWDCHSLLGCSGSPGFDCIPWILLPILDPLSQLDLILPSLDWLSTGQDLPLDLKQEIKLGAAIAPRNCDCGTAQKMRAYNFESLNTSKYFVNNSF